MGMVLADGIHMYQMNEAHKHRFQIKTKPLTQKDLESFFRPRSQQGSAVNSDEDAVSPSVSVVSDTDVVEEAIVENADAVEAEEAVGGVVEAEEAVEAKEVVDEVVEEVVAPVEAVKTKLRTRNRVPCVPCKCTIAGPCYGQQYSSQATLAVHTANKHGDPTKANEKRLRVNALCATYQKRRRLEDADWREHERERSAANRYK